MFEAPGRRVSLQGLLVSTLWRRDSVRSNLLVTGDCFLTGCSPALQHALRAGSEAQVSQSSGFRQHAPHAKRPRNDTGCRLHYLL